LPVRFVLCVHVLVTGSKHSTDLFKICMRDLHKILCSHLEFVNSPFCGFLYCSDAVKTSDCVVMIDYMQVGDEL
jgi:hypothetical protein